jgi:hypothetical protein
MCSRTARVDDALRDALMIEVLDLVAKDEVLEQGRPAKARLERALVIRDRRTLVGGQGAPAGIDPDATERTIEGVMA